jgi:polyisoprenoid-binding protein YceI
MELSIVAFGIISILSLVSWIKQQNRLNITINNLFIVVLLVSTLQGFKSNEAGIDFITYATILITANWFISLFLEKKWNYLISFVSVLSIIFWNGSLVEFTSYPVLFDSKNALLLILIGSLYPITVYKRSQKYAEYLQIPDKTLTTYQHLIGIGVLYFTASFFGGTLGVFLVAIGYYITELYLTKSENTTPAYSLILFLLAFVTFFIKSNQIELETITHGSFFLGLFVGISGAFLLASLHEKMSKLALSLLLLLPLGLISGVIFSETIKEHTGGYTAFVGILFGLSALIYRYKKENFLLFLFLSSFTLFVGYLAKPSLLQTLNKVEQKELNSKFETEEEIELPANEKITDTLASKTTTNSADTIKVVNPLLGTWKINSSASKLTFELGPPDARTQGEFGEINGSFDLTDNLKTNKVIVELPLSKFTTFNDYRDESLFKSEFLDIAKQAVLTFESSSWKQKGKKYLVSGNFKMKGVSQTLVIELKIVGQGKDKKGNYLLISGSSALDRTKFDMSSDPKIGDLVDFKFQLELRK